MTQPLIFTVLRIFRQRIVNLVKLKTQLLKYPIHTNHIKQDCAVKFITTQPLKYHIKNC